MDGQEFINIVSKGFAPFLKELGFSLNTPSISGRMYRADFSGSRNVVSISYEPGNDALFIAIFSLENGVPSSYDDLLKTPRLANLNKRYMHLVTASDRFKNEAAFESVRPAGRVEKLLMKSAKELRLILPKYLAETSSISE